MQKIVSFDVWDTLIKRKCNPEEIKLFTARYILFKYESRIIDKYKDIYEILRLRNKIEDDICRENEEKGFDAECRIEDVFLRLQETIFKSIGDNICNELLRVEIEHEKKMIYVNIDALEIINQYKDHKLYCISDFYMGKKSLKEIIDSIDELNGRFEDIYSSADYLLNKRSGNLYKKFEDNLGISAKDHIHVGDNIYSDIDVAQKIGIETITMKKYGEFKFLPIKNRAFEFNLNSLKIKNSSNNTDKLYNLGVDLSPLLYFFVSNLIEYGIKNNVKEIYYQTREGETFIKIHELIQKNNIYEMELPKSKILEVSRVATFGASLKEISIEELLRLWSQYRKQSLKSLFKTLNIDIKKYETVIKKYGIDKCENIEEPWFNVSIQKLFKDKEFLKNMNKELVEKRERLIKFFESKNIYNDNKPLLLVDLGWRGTIQDNLAYIYENKNIEGYYYALYDYYNVQPENTRKFAFIKNKELCNEYIAPMITLFEMLFNPETGSVVDYDGDKAIRKVKENEYNTVKNITSHIQKGMMDGAEKINEYLKYHPYVNDEFNDYVSNIIKDMKEKPSKELVEAYYSLVHNDVFGTGEYIDKRSKLSIIDKLNILKCRRLLRQEQWKEAFIIHNNIEFLQLLLKLKAKIRGLKGGNND